MSQRSVGLDILDICRRRRLCTQNATYITAESGATALSAEYAVVVPWYLAMIDAPVQEHVKASVLEYLDLLKGDICR